ncbi:hypothetical protein D3C81_1553120 [compost metagenome]
MPAMQDGGFDDVRLAAVQPVLVRQVRKALVAACIRTMALRAVIQEQPFPNRLRLRIRRHRFQILLLVFGKQRTVFGIGFFQFIFVSTCRLPAQLAGVTAEAGIQHQVSEAEYDGQVKQPHPPAWHRRIQLGQVFIPDVAGGFRRPPGFGVDLDLDLGLRPQQQPATGDAEQRQYRDVKVPEAVGEISHACSPAVPCLLHLQMARAPLLRNRCRDAG